MVSGIPLCFQKKKLPCFLRLGLIQHYSLPLTTIIDGDTQWNVPKKPTKDAERCEQCILPTKPNANRCCRCKTCHLIKKNDIQPSWVNFESAGSCGMNTWVGTRVIGGKSKRWDVLSVTKTLKSIVWNTQNLSGASEKAGICEKHLQMLGEKMIKWVKYSSAGVSQIFGNTEIPKWCEKMLFTPFLKCKSSTSGFVQTFQPI